MAYNNRIALECCFLRHTERDTSLHVCLVDDDGILLFQDSFLPANENLQNATNLTNSVLPLLKSYLNGRILIGFDLKAKLRLLNIAHPVKKTKELRNFGSIPEFGALSLRELAKLFLNIDSDQFDIVQRTQVTMALYHYHCWKINGLSRSRREFCIIGSSSFVIEDLIAPHCVSRTTEVPTSCLLLHDSSLCAARCIALDCEMVGVGSNGSIDALARVSIVDEHGVVLYDKYVKATAPVTCYRTWVSGITPYNLSNGYHFNEVQKEVQSIIIGKVVVGFALRHDLQVMNFSCPETVDLAKESLISEYCKLNLRQLAKLFLNVSIQNGPHDSVQDAQATMALFHYHRWKINGISRKELPVFITDNQPVVIEKLKPLYDLHAPIYKNDELSMAVERLHLEPDSAEEYYDEDLDFSHGEDEDFPPMRLVGSNTHLP